jgi:hypothetical protein
MSLFLEGIGAILSKITNHVQNREERRRNEIDKLEDERRSIITSDPCTVKSAQRIAVINDRLRVLRTQAKNSH